MLPSPGRKQKRAALGYPCLFAFGLLCLTAMIAVSHPVQHARASAERAFEVVLGQGAPAREQTTLKARVGDAVTLTVHSDKAITLHLHGYDRELMVPAGGKSSLRLDARIPGRFPIESHDAHGHGALLYLEVRPD